MSKSETALVQRAATNEEISFANNNTSTTHINNISSRNCGNCVSDNNCVFDTITPCTSTTLTNRRSSRRRFTATMGPCPCWEGSQ